MLARYLGNHILTKSRLQLQLPLLAGAQRAAPVAVSLPGAVVSKLQRGRGGGGDRRGCHGPVSVVREGLHARAIGLRQEKIIRKLAKANEQRRYPGQDHELLLMFPETPQRRQHGSVDVRQQPRRRVLQRSEAVFWRVVLRLRPAGCHHGRPQREQLRATAGEAKPLLCYRVRTLSLSPLTQRNPRAQINPVWSQQRSYPKIGVSGSCSRAEAPNHRAVALMARGRGLEATRGYPSGGAVSGGGGCGEAPAQEWTRTGWHADQHGLCVP